MIPSESRCNFLGSILVLSLWLWPTDLTVAGDNNSDETKIRTQLETAISEYQMALAESDADSRKARFQKAEIAFSSLYENDSGEVRFSPELYVNWGNAALQNGKTGIAVFAYRKALSLDGFHKRAKNNLAIVRSQMPEWTQSTTERTMSIQHLLFWNQWYSKATLRILLASSFLFGCLVFASAYFSERMWIRNLCVVPFAIWILLLISQIYNQEDKDENAVVFVQTETSAHTADSSNSPTSFTSAIPGGTEAIALETRDDWTHVRFGENREGWVQNSAIRRINPS